MYHCLVVMRPKIALVLKPELVAIANFYNGIDRETCYRQYLVHFIWSVLILIHLIKFMQNLFGGVNYTKV